MVLKKLFSPALNDAGGFDPSSGAAPKAKIMHRPLRIGLGLVLAIHGAAIALSQEFSPPKPSREDRPSAKGYVCHRASRPIVVDGRLEEAWNQAPWTDDFVDIEGDRKPRPRYRTRVKMLWDDAALYIAAELEEPHVGAVLTEHDSYIFHHDNDFEVFLDPDGDGHLYAELEMNARNTTWDLLLTKPYRFGGKAIDAWEIAGLRTAVRVDGTLDDPRDRDRGWTIEIAWPWKGLKQLASCPVPPRDGDRWRINFSRVQLTQRFEKGRYRKVPGSKEENWVWSPQGLVNMHLPERWGELMFSTAAAGSVAFRPDPAEPARRALHRILAAQEMHRRKHGRWAAHLRELGPVGDLGTGLTGARIETTSTRFEASVHQRFPRTKGETWHIDSEGRLWKD